MSRMLIGCFELSSSNMVLNGENTGKTVRENQNNQSKTEVTASSGAKVKVGCSVPDSSSLFFEEPPQVAESDVSSDDDESIASGFSAFETADSFCSNSTEPSSISVAAPKPASSCPAPPRKPLEWEFSGLTLWLELEEFNLDLTKAIHHAATAHGTAPIPKSHTTAIYGMEHLTVDEARSKLHSIKDKIPAWPVFSKPVGVVQDIAVAGRPGQVCTIAWSELTLSTNSEHERALDILYEIFYGKDFTRQRPWKPHNSIAYDNPEDSALNLLETVGYVARNPTLLGKERRVEAISLWDTNGKMGDWKCLDRIRFW